MTTIPTLINGECNSHHWPYHVAGRLVCGCRAHFGQPFAPHRVAVKVVAR